MSEFMSDIELKRLRDLRSRAESLLDTLIADLKPFCHNDRNSGFLRTPDSQSLPGDVNVTTTCSCLMALALTGSLDKFYDGTGEQTAAKIFKRLLDAPWMSSGLAENNAFTTTLILRTFGFLVEGASISTKQQRKAWEPYLTIKNFTSFARKLVKREDPLSGFLFNLMPHSVQTCVKTFLYAGEDEDRTKKAITKEIGRIVRTTALYDEARCSHVKLSDRTLDAMGHDADAYSTARLNRLLLDDAYPRHISRVRLNSLHQIAKRLSEDPECFGINEYASAAAVIYWFVDGVDRAGFELPEENWTRLCKRAATEFYRQRSLVVANHAATMDPIAMAMAACLCARLRAISGRGSFGATSAHQESLPSIVELEQSIRELVDEQTPSGIWPKYFPLFHYQEAGSNFCFTFELLEAILAEFGDEQNRLVTDRKFIDGLEHAVRWCELNRLKYSKAPGTVPFEGWNSGGLLNTLQKGQPESWATAVVHMSLWELVNVLSRHIQERILKGYAAETPSSKLANILDINLYVNREQRSLRKTIEEKIVNSLCGEAEKVLRTRLPKKGLISALLFGPPGTSKTQLAKCVAAELTWPLVKIDPSHFLQGSFQNIYVQAEKIFEDLADLSRVVVLFDELDALVQKRDDQTAAIDTESKFLTTYMLPKLAMLHDRRRIVFLMATNFQENFDDAIKRAGRFDLLLCVGPPTLPEKCQAIHVFYGLSEKTEETDMAGKKIMEFCEGDMWLKQQLELYTFGEFKQLLSAISNESDIGSAVTKLRPEGFGERVKQDSRTAGLRLEEADAILQKYGAKTIWDLDNKDIAPKDLKKWGDDPMPRYLRDRRLSKFQ